MRILGSSIEPSWLSLGRERSRLRNIDMCATRSGPLSRTARRTLNLLESSLLQTRDQPPPWHEGANKASPGIVLLRTITAYHLEKFCVDFKIINTISISMSQTKYAIYKLMLSNECSIKYEPYTEHHQKNIVTLLKYLYMVKDKAQVLSVLHGYFVVSQWCAS